MCYHSLLQVINNFLGVVHNDDFIIWSTNLQLGKLVTVAEIASKRNARFQDALDDNCVSGEDKVTAKFGIAS